MTLGLVQTYDNTAFMYRQHAEEGTYSGQALNSCATLGFAQLFQVANLALFALLKSKTACPCAVCLPTAEAALVFCEGPLGFSAKPMLGVVSVALNVVPSACMQLEQRNVYVQCVLLTYVPFAIGTWEKVPVATAGDAWLLPQCEPRLDDDYIHCITYPVFLKLPTTLCWLGQATNKSLLSIALPRLTPL